MDSILEDSVDEGNLADPNNDLVDTISEMFTDEHTLDYSSPPLYDDVDDDLVELESDNDDIYDDPFDSKEDKIKVSKLLIGELDPPRSSDFLPSSECDSVLYEDFFEVDALSSTNNKDKVFNPGILIHENLFEVTIRVTPNKNVKKISISNASLILEDFKPPLNELRFHKEVLGSETLLSFSSENEKIVFNLGFLLLKEFILLFFRNYLIEALKLSKSLKNFKARWRFFLALIKRTSVFWMFRVSISIPHEQLNSRDGSSLPPPAQYLVHQSIAASRRHAAASYWTAASDVAASSAPVNAAGHRRSTMPVTVQRRSTPPATGQRRQITVVIGGQRRRPTTVSGGEPPLTAAGPPLTSTGPPVNGGWWAGQRWLVGRSTSGSGSGLGRVQKWHPDKNLLKEDVSIVPVWVKLHGVPITAFSEDGLSVIATKLGTPLMLDSYTSDMCMQSWGRLSYARVMIELRADVDLKDKIGMAMPKITREGHYTCNVRVEYEWKPPRCLSCKVFGHIHEECPKNTCAGEKKTVKKPSQTSRGVSFGTNGRTTNLVNNEATSSGSSFMNIDNDGDFASNTHIDKIERKICEGKLRLLDNDGNPLVPTSIVESDSEVETDSYPNNDDYGSYDDDMYKNHDLSEHLQSIGDDLDITGNIWRGLFGSISYAALKYHRSSPIMGNNSTKQF
nr:hypothetical protein [Tanacetum cinerariifolium]